MNSKIYFVKYNPKINQMGARPWYFVVVFFVLFSPLFKAMKHNAQLSWFKPPKLKRKHLFLFPAYQKTKDSFTTYFFDRQIRIEINENFQSSKDEHSTPEVYKQQNRKKQATTRTLSYYLKLNHSIKSIRDSGPALIIKIHLQLMMSIAFWLSSFLCWRFLNKSRMYGFWCFMPI